MDKISVSVPGRICLFGEHQDYLKLPVITAAINLRITVTGTPAQHQKLHIYLPDIHSEEILPLPGDDQELSYNQERDYFKSVYNVLLRHGVKIDRGYDITVRGNIPINSGTSSSSSLIIAWTQFLIQASGNTDPKYRDPEHIAYLGYLAEVEEFGEPGGMMDHYTTAIGGALYLQFSDRVKVTPLSHQLKTFVLGDSVEPKETRQILRRVKFGVLDAVKKIQQEHSEFSLMNAKTDQVSHYRRVLTGSQMEVLEGALLNRDITGQAKHYFSENEFDPAGFGRLLNEHQEVLDRKLKISTSKINRMLKSALDVGAYGGKINGSGGGGCMFVYAPENPQKVAKAIENVGGKAYIIQIDRRPVVDA